MVRVAVLLPALEAMSGWRILAAKRSDTLDHHKRGPLPVAPPLVNRHEFARWSLMN
jgi:hypothetical protein